MTNLLDIEAAVLSTANVDVRRISQLTSEIADAKKSKFDKSVKLSSIVAETFEWFKGDEAKASFSEAGVEWSIEDFHTKLFGWKKAFFYKMVKAGSKVTNDEGNQSVSLKAFKRECKSLEDNGENPSRSIESYLKFCKTSEANDGEGDGEVETRSATIMTFSMKGEMFEDGKGVSVRLSADGQLAISGDSDKLPHGVMQSFIDSSRAVITEAVGEAVEQELV